MKNLVLSVSALFLAVSPSIASAYHHAEMDKPNIVEIAVSNDSFSTLVAAVQAAGLVETLTGEGPFTVFAPTNEAFAGLPEGTLEMLLEPENKDTLVDILTYHVLPGKVPAASVLQHDFATTVQGSEVEFTQQDGSVFVNDAKVTATDIMGSNGIIHVIDRVILPPEDTAPTQVSQPSGNTIAEIASNNPDFSTLVSLLVQEDLVGAMQDGGPFTVFAPTDEAFARMPSIFQRRLANNPQLLREVLLAHVVPGRLMAGDVLQNRYLETANRQELPIGSLRGEAYVSDSKIIATDIEASNGVIHVIDRVIFPRNLLR